MSNVRIETVRELKLLQPVCGCESTAKPVDPLNSISWQSSGSFHIPSFNHFPIIVDIDGSGWNLGNRYLLSKLEEIVAPNHRTLESIARDLAAFLKWVNRYSVDFLNADGQRPGQRPTYRYTRFLQDQVEQLDIGVRTAKRRINSVVNFYRWLQAIGYKFSKPLWRESNVSVRSEDRYGVMRRSSVTTTDLSRSFKVSNFDTTYSGLIKDGGNLRPMTEEQQQLLVESLVAIGNREMMLAFVFALSTGARMQTVLTLRLRHLELDLHGQATSANINIGRTTGVDSKAGKQMALQVPVWLYEKLRIYVQSERYLTRLRRSPHIYPDDSDQYVFLTKSGKPFYMARNDPFAGMYRNPPRGNAIAQFIRQQLQPEIDRSEESFKCRFHDLRATFGMNIVRACLREKQLTKVPSENLPDYFDLIRYVATRMGHSNPRTTEAYLKYGWDFSIALSIQERYEAFLQDAYQRMGDTHA